MKSYKVKDAQMKKDMDSTYVRDLHSYSGTEGYGKKINSHKGSMGWGVDPHKVSGCMGYKKS